MEVMVLQTGFNGLFALLWEIYGIFGEIHVILPCKGKGEPMNWGKGGWDGVLKMLHRYKA